MENNEQQILAEIKSMMATLRQQMEMLDAKMAELQQMTLSVGTEVVPIDLDLSSFSTEETIVATSPEVPDDDLPFDGPLVATEPEIVAGPVATTLEAPELVALDESEPVVLDEPEPVVLDEPESVLLEEAGQDVVEEQVAIIDAMTEKQAWRTDMPGSPVKDVRLAISLHERVLFINHLFSEDPMAFQATINRINASESLSQVVDYVKETFPHWNLDSDLVYRFMMAVRRKIR